jgi:RHS repeat-associated protein
MNVGVEAAQNDALEAILSDFCSSSGKREEDTLSVMWRAYPDGKSGAQSREKSPSGVGGHIYIGQYFDAASSLSYLNARYYDGSRGQFLSEDPIFLGNPSGQNLSDPQSLNTYSYSEDNPTSKSDPAGKQAVPYNPWLFAAYLLFAPIYTSYDPVYEAGQYQAQNNPTNKALNAI